MFGTPVKGSMTNFKVGQMVKTTLHITGSVNCQHHFPDVIDSYCLFLSPFLQLQIITPSPQHYEHDEACSNLVIIAIINNLLCSLRTYRTHARYARSKHAVRSGRGWPGKGARPRLCPGPQTQGSSILKYGCLAKLTENSNKFTTKYQPDCVCRYGKSAKGSR